MARMTARSADLTSRMSLQDMLAVHHTREYIGLPSMSYCPARGALSLSRALSWVMKLNVRVHQANPLSTDTYALPNLSLALSAG